MPTNTLIPFPPELLAAKKQIRAQARSYGLDFYDTVFEMCDFEQMNQIASLGGFPQRYPHWRWGMEYERMRKQHFYGLGRIYEMVINNDPCYAYLQESNALVDQKLVIAHVYAHCDFFKNNLWFGQTNRKQMDEMANHATRVRRHIEKHGYDTVERWLDVCIVLEDLIDPYSVFMKRQPSAPARDAKPAEPASSRFAAKDYMDRWINPPSVIEAEEKKRRDDAAKVRHATPVKPTRDVLLYLLEHARLEDWQADCLAMIRQEAYYYAPQGMTKIMNEGWATYWHSKLMTTHFLEASEVIDYADHHSGTVHMPPGGFNPYKIGVEMFRDIEDRWNKGKFGREYEESADRLGEQKRWDKGLGLGREKIFEVRKLYNDVTFIDEFMTDEFIHKHRYYQYGKDPHTGQLKIVSRDPQRIRQALMYRLTNMGRPFVYVVDGNYANRGELYLAHQHNGLDVEIKFAVETLKNLYRVWGRPCHLQARIDDEMMLFSFDGNQAKQQTVRDDTPRPAHRVN
jgi:stage V sporulation protein R